MKEKVHKTPDFKTAITIFAIVMIWAVACMAFLGIPIVMMLLGALVFVAACAMIILGYSFEEVLELMGKGVSNSMSGIYFFFLIGALIASWMLSGCLPAIIYYGLDLLSPVIFLPTTFILASILSVCTGSAWTTASTIGIICMGIGTVLGVPAPMIAGAVISGAFFGDKMSPISDSTNMAPMSSGTDVWTHVRAMAPVSGLAYVISFVLYIVIGMQFSANKVDMEEVVYLQSVISETFNVSVYVMIPMLIVVVLSLMRKNPILVLVIGIIAAVPFALLQGFGFVETMSALTNGVSLEIADPMIAKIVNRGGITYMFETMSIVITALSFGGLMTGVGIFPAIIHKVFSHVKNPRLYPMIGILTSFVLVFGTADDYPSLTMVGPMLGEAYDEVGLDRSMLSRNIEEGGTLVSSICPYAATAMYNYATLGVAPLEYLPYLYFNISNILLGMILPLLGLTIVTKASVDAKREKAAQKASAK